MKEQPLQISLPTALMAAITSILCLAFSLQQRAEQYSERTFVGTEREIQQVSLQVFQAFQILGDEIPRNVPDNGTLDCRRMNTLERQDGSVMSGWRSVPDFVTDCSVFIADGFEGSDRYVVMVDGLIVKGSFRSINGRSDLTMANVITERNKRVLQKYFERVSAALNPLTKDQLTAQLKFTWDCEQFGLKDAQGNPISHLVARPASLATCAIVRSGQRFILTVTGSYRADNQVYTRTFEK